MSNRCVFVLFFLILGTATPLSAQTREETARADYESGTRAYQEGRWLDCAHDFERSFTGVFAPELLYNVGLCYQRALSNLPDVEAEPMIERSLAAYQRYLRELPQTTDADRVHQEIANLQARLTQINASTPEPQTVVSTPQEAATATSTPETAPTEDPQLVFETVPRGQYPVTILAGALTLVSTAVAIGLGAHAQDLYSGLSQTCAPTPQGCSMDAINEVSSFSLAANILYGLSAAFFAGTGIGFGLEFTATDSRPTRLAFTVSGSF